MFKAVVSPAYDRVIRKSLAAQLIIGVLAALMLDGGTTARVVGVAVLAFWLGAAFMISHRPYQPTRLDLAVIRWGFWPALIVAMLGQWLA